MKVLVTGANGYIGSKVVKILCNMGVQVIATDLCDNHIDSRAKYVGANIFEPNDDWFSFFSSPDVCIHLAWRDGFVHNSPRHMGDLSSHYCFVQNLIDHGLKKIVSIGTMHEVGYWEGAINENTPCNPLSQYGIAKNALRRSIELLSAERGCAFQWLRCFYIFGDDHFGNSIFCKIRKASDLGQKTFPFTSGKNKYDFINVYDLAGKIAKCAMQNEVLGIINCCSGKAIALSEQVEWYIRENGLRITLEYGKYPDRPYDSPCVYGDNSKILQIESLFNK